MKLHDKFYWYPYRGFRNNGNTCIFKGEMCALIDPGHVFNLENLIHSINKDGFNIKDIDLIIISHGHPDHCEATLRLRRLTNAKVAIHRLEEECLPKYKLYGHIPMFKVDFHLSDELELGDLKLQVIHTPGHSPGSVSLYWPFGRILFTGDVVFYEGVGRADLYGGDLQALKKSIEILSKLEVEYLLPGHHYNFPSDHIGLIKGRRNVEKNFEYIKRVFF